MNLYPAFVLCLSILTCFVFSQMSMSVNTKDSVVAVSALTWVGWVVLGVYSAYIVGQLNGV